MKKRMILLLLLAAAVLLLTACGNSSKDTDAAPAAAETPETVVTDAPEESAEPETAEAATLAERVKAAAEVAEALAPFSAEELTDMSGIDPADYTDFVFLQGNGMDGREILALRAKDGEAAERLAGQMQAYLERRREEMESYAPEAYKLYSAAKVERKGLLLVMISGGNAGAETEALLAGE